MSNLKQDLLEATNGEEPICVVLVDTPWCGNRPNAWASVAAVVGKPLTWRDASVLMDQEYDDGFGVQDCPNFHAWTRDRVYFIHEYDGSTSIISEPRNPPDFT